MYKNSMETIDFELAVLLRRITSISSQKSVGTLDRSAYLLLQQIMNHQTEGEEVGVKGLAEEFQLDMSTVSRQTAALEQKGHVTRIPDPQDGRAYFLRVTEQGMAELNKSKEIRIALLTELFQSWTGEESKQLGELLQKLNRTFVQFH